MQFTPRPFKESDISSKKSLIFPLGDGFNVHIIKRHERY